jgi:hypothetical protein
MGKCFDWLQFYKMIFITFGEQVRFMKKIFFALLVIALSACNTHKKPKCNTCPKWDNQVQQPAQ